MSNQYTKDLPNFLWHDGHSTWWSNPDDPLFLKYAVVKEKEKDIETAINNLIYYNNWRKGSGLTMPNPKDITKSIDDVLLYLAGHKNEK